MASHELVTVPRLASTVCLVLASVLAVLPEFSTSAYVAPKPIPHFIPGVWGLREPAVAYICYQPHRKDIIANRALARCTACHRAQFSGFNDTFVGRLARLAGKVNSRATPAKIRALSYLAKVAIMTSAGDVVEAGVTSGASALVFAHIISSYDVCGRTVWALANTPPDGSGLVLEDGNGDYGEDSDVDAAELSEEEEEAMEDGTKDKGGDVDGMDGKQEDAVKRRTAADAGTEAEAAEAEAAQAEAAEAAAAEAAEAEAAWAGGQQQRRQLVANAAQAQPQGSETDWADDEVAPGDVTTGPDLLELVQDRLSRVNKTGKVQLVTTPWDYDTDWSRIKEISLLRINTATYEATWHVLYNLYEKVLPGGFVFVDRYADIPEVMEAVDQFRAQRRMFEGMRWVRETGEEEEAQRRLAADARGKDGKPELPAMPRRFSHTPILGVWWRKISELSY
eukprot:CAMPEP_0202893588 /NCGR_PEP_ID=MMETSP1392-20130828/3144_1 /ASSEMBLY_ACC=CAM_ASM_000868 /TAXON_ID=225041 /ORGANISM="Chlamydomonas chlamydogama, Strain SAG 11-48b" /LENGTH=450 /DNA_ID=CAMNT_0049577973 /DNA_START=77 /DNA_END=1429 /DNA_ORIENTATION=+